MTCQPSRLRCLIRDWLKRMLRITRRGGVWPAYTPVLITAPGIQM